MKKEIVKQIFTDYLSIVLGMVSLLLFLVVGYKLIDFERLKLTFNLGYATIHVILHILLSFLFSLLVMVWTYKVKKQKVYNKKKSGFFSIVGGIIGIIITGCPVCGGWTLISLFGLTNILAYLPWYGLELKLLSVFLLFWSLDSSISNLDRCQIFSFKSWVKRKPIIISILVLLGSILSIKYIMLPENSVKLPGNTLLIPSSEYVIFPYELQTGCSNTLFFIEFLPKVDTNIKVIGIYSYNYETLEKFTACKYHGLKEDLSIEAFQKIINEYKETKNTKLIGKTKFLAKYSICENYEFGYCLQGDYWFIKNNVAHKITVNLISGSIANQKEAIGVLDLEVAKQQIK